MAEVSIKGAIRNEFGKGASRRIRRDGNVPAVIYGHGEKPTHISLPAREVGVAIKTSNVLLNIDLEGKEELVLPKSIVRNPLKGTLEHIDLIIVRRGERVVVHVPVHAHGVVLKSDPKMVVIHLSVRAAAEEVVPVAAAPAEGEAAAAAPAEGAAAEEGK